MRINLPELLGGATDRLKRGIVLRIIKVLAALTALAITTTHVVAQEQISDLGLRKALTESAVFSAQEFSALERGEAVVKLLPANDRREVAVCGVMKLPAGSGTSLTAFQFSLNQLNQKNILQLGRFSNPPKLEDVAHLTLSRRDIDDLKQCVIHDCKLGLSANMIERFRQTIDWNAPDTESKANQLFRQLLLDYVLQYLQQGDTALIEYADQRVPVKLGREQQALMSKLLYAKDGAPEFVDYLKQFPKTSLPNVEHSLTWAKINFGLKPVIIVNDISTYRSADMSRILSISKQVYAHHYFDASLSLTAVVGVDSQSKRTSYLLYANYSRASALATSLSKFKHRVVEDEAQDDLRDLLQQTRTNVDAAINNAPAVAQPNSRYRVVEWFRGLPSVIQWLVAVAIIIASALALYRLARSASRMQIRNKRDRI